MAPVRIVMPPLIHSMIGLSHWQGDLGDGPTTGRSENGYR